MVRTSRDLDNLDREGLGSGFLSSLPHAAAERLLAEAIRINVPAGSIVYSGDEAPSLIVVVKGLLRASSRPRTDVR